MPYWRLSGFYFAYFATLGVLVPYFGLYLKSIGFDARAIGNLIALMMLSRIVAPLVWAWVVDHHLADHHAGRMRVVRLSSLLTVLVFSGVFISQSFGWLAVVMIGFSFFWHASLPVLEVFTLNHYAHRPGGYGRVRLWGSLGFIASVTAVGALVDSQGPGWVPPVLWLLMLTIWLCSLALPAAEINGPTEQPARLRDVLRRPEVLAFLAACFFMQAGHGPYYTFYSIYLEEIGWSKTTIGLLWAFAVLCEIGVFLLMPRLLARVSLRTVLLVSFSLAAVRWLLIGAGANHLGLLVLGQTLHAATFGMFHGAAVQVVHRFFTGRHQHRGQAIYGSFSYGVGGAAGSFVSGQLWTEPGPLMTFAVASGCAAVAFLFVGVFIGRRSGAPVAGT